MNTPKISVCSKICNECGFNGSTTDTLYAEFYNIVIQGTLFPCHMYLKSQTGCEFLGTETLDTIKVCRGYVAYMKKYHSFQIRRSKVWEYLTSQIEPKELDSILSLEDLKANHVHLRDGIYLGNSRSYYDK